MLVIHVFFYILHVTSVWIIVLLLRKVFGVAMVKERHVQFKSVDDAWCSDWHWDSPEAPEGVNKERWVRFQEEVSLTVKNNGRRQAAYVFGGVVFAAFIVAAILTAIGCFFTLTEAATTAFVVALTTGSALCGCCGAYIFTFYCMNTCAFSKVEELCDSLTSEHAHCHIKVRLTDKKFGRQDFRKVIHIIEYNVSDAAAQDPEAQILGNETNQAHSMLCGNV
ncbi:unnamed protein product [Durusdinium trenchii]|uniref:Candidate inclusion membrane protein n=1 Tax=Durusdinium trenchii TaxID=1381693 RepID=A0ABP0I1L3_9DINO